MVAGFNEHIKCGPDGEAQPSRLLDGESSSEATVQTEIMSRREALEMHTPTQLQQLKARMLDEMSNLERDVHLVNDVLDGYGVRDIQNGHIVLGEN